MSNNAKLAERDCFILDFVNDREEIKEAFQTYYGKIELEGEYTIEELKQLKEKIEKANRDLAEVKYQYKTN